VVWSEFHLDAVAGQDADVMHAHLSGDVGQHLVAVLQFDAEPGVRERFDDRSFENDRVFLLLCQNYPPDRSISWVMRWPCAARRRAANPAQGRRGTLARRTAQANSAPYQTSRRHGCMRYRPVHRNELAVRISGPWSVTATVCSAWAAQRR